MYRARVQRSVNITIRQFQLSSKINSTLVVISTVVLELNNQCYCYHIHVRRLPNS